MSEIIEILAVAGLFLLRIGLPLLVLITVGIVVERAYDAREQKRVAAEVEE